LDAPVDPAAGAGQPALRPHAQKGAAAGETPDFDQFLQKPKASATAAGPNPAVSAGPSKPGVVPTVSPRRSRDRAPAVAAAAGAATTATEPTPPLPSAAAAIIDPSNIPLVPPPAAVENTPPPADDEIEETFSAPSGAPASSSAPASALLTLEASQQEDGKGILNQQAAGPSPAALTSLETALAAKAAPPGFRASQPARFADRPAKAAGSAAAAASPPTTAADDPPTDFDVSEIRSQAAPTPPPDVGAKIAAQLPGASPAVEKADAAGQKKSLLSVEQMDKQSPVSVGIDAAQPSPAMPAETLDPAASRQPPLPSASAPAGTATAAASADASQASSSARVAVEAVVKLVDAQTGRAQEPVSAVSLNFKFGSEDLAVRVEWRNGEVHTQFRTDSPDLRAALASQWQAASPGTGDRSTVFASPVFSSTGDQAPSTAGDGRNAWQYGQQGSSDSSGSARTPRQNARTAAPEQPSDAGPSPLSTALRLHTFA